MQVRNHNIVVTGGAGGLGREVALSLAAAGASIAIVDLNEAGANAVVREITVAGGRAIAVCGDLTKRDSAHALFQRAGASFGRINGLINCAGVYPRRPILEISDEDWDFSFSVNVRGLYHMSVAAVEHMREKGGGRIVNVASIDAFKAHPKNAHYAAMKAAVVSLTKSLGEAAAPYGVLINGVAPGAIATEKAKASGFLKEVIAETPIGFAAEPRDIADVIQFLVSEQNRFMVGETVVVSGGYFIP
jgi:NAD(P)-dependent dehydrogenase (short-subunit alcohol dehydrogenase family)